MNKLNRIKLQNAVMLKEQEMKAIYGGSGGGVCAYSTTHSGAATCLLYGGPAGAEFMAGPAGWWCCNCQEAYFVCRS